jgi:propanol-preferring alcohol dehydrogenase
LKSYRIEAFGAPLACVEIATPSPSGTEVLLEVRAAGVCHTDLHVWEGGYDLGGGRFLKMSERGVSLPHTLGHETVGRVVALGPQAGGVALGETRLVYPWIGCGACANCRAGEEQLCTGGPRFLGIFRDGGYATHLLVPHPRYLVDITGLTAEEAAPLACAGLTAFGAVKKLGRVVAEAPILVIGAGGLGLMCLAVLRALEARGAVVVDLDAAKRAAALQAGALAAFDPQAPDAAAAIAEALGGPAAAAIDFVGSPQTVRLGVDHLAKGGTCIVVGLLGGEITLSIPPFPLRAIAVAGSFVGSLSDLRELIGLVQAGKVPRIPLVTRPLETADATLHDLGAGRLVGRAVLVP